MCVCGLVWWIQFIYFAFLFGLLLLLMLIKNYGLRKIRSRTRKKYICYKCFVFSNFQPFLTDNEQFKKIVFFRKKFIAKIQMENNTFFISIL